jgi:UDP-N-acetyl-D-mannosaminuronic acid dehydrogenase
LNYPSTHPIPAADTRQPLADLTVVGGAGHVGIPLVLAFAEAGLTVNINDLNETALASLRAGKLPFIEHGAAPLLAKALAENRLVFTSKPEQIGRRGPVIITIGTPVDEFLNPDLQAVSQCIEAIAGSFGPGQLIVLRSTVYPGTTDWLAARFAEQGRDLKVAFCPERVVQGKAIVEIQTLPQIVSGTTPEAEEEAARLFARICPEIVRTRPLEAELSKIYANTYRYIEFATTNQLFAIAQAAGADYFEILRTLKYSYPRAAHIPGPGFSAGPCLFKDTMQLAAFSKNRFDLGRAAMSINEGMVFQVIDMAGAMVDLETSTVGLLGMAFKANVDDIRASLSYKLKKNLLPVCREVLATDPFVTVDETLRPLDEVIDKADILILCTPHGAYRGLDTRGKPVVDVWGFF